ncbi:MAG: hypothetical protein WEB67_12635 [Acidimicrobiia bacterium]
MKMPFDIKGGASEFEAAVIAVVLDHVTADEVARAAGRNSNDNRVPGWVRALSPEIYPSRFEQKRPSPT